MSKITVDTIEPSTGTTVTLGGSGDTLSVPSGVTLNVASGGTITNSGSMSGFGKVLQVVQTHKSDTFTSTSTSFADITGLSASITPSSASNKILVLVHISGVGVPGTTQVFCQLNRDGSAIGVGDAAGNRTQTSGSTMLVNDSNSIATNAFNYLDSPSTTSSITYKIQMKVSASTGYINRSLGDTDSAGRPRGTSSITLMEIEG